MSGKNIAFATLAIVSLVASAPSIARGSGHSYGGYHTSSRGTGEHRVHSYTTKSGTYVAPHYQTNSNRTRNDNYSTVGNTNPHTGKAGTKPRDN